MRLIFFLLFITSLLPSVSSISRHHSSHNTTQSVVTHTTPSTRTILTCSSTIYSLSIDNTIVTWLDPDEWWYDDMLHIRLTTSPYLIMSYIIPSLQFNDSYIITLHGYDETHRCMTYTSKHAYAIDWSIPMRTDDIRQKTMHLITFAMPAIHMEHHMIQHSHPIQSSSTPISAHTAITLHHTDVSDEIYAIRMITLEKNRDPVINVEVTIESWDRVWQPLLSSSSPLTLHPFLLTIMDIYEQPQYHIEAHVVVMEPDIISLGMLRFQIMFASYKLLPA